jgi:hypothetical protein
MSKMKQMILVLGIAVSVVAVQKTTTVAPAQ